MSTRARDRLGVHQQPVGGQSQHAHVGAQLSLVVEQRRVAALARLERLHVVGHLALEELGGLAALEPITLRPARSTTPASACRARIRRWRSPSDSTAARMMFESCLTFDSIEAMKELRKPKLSRRKLLGGAAATAAAFPLLHELAPHQGVHDHLRAAGATPTRQHGHATSHPGRGPPGRGRPGRPRANGFDPSAILRDYDRGKVRREGGRTVREFELVAEDKEIEVAPGVKYAAWTYNWRSGARAARDGGRARARPVCQWLEASAHDPLPRHTPRSERRRAGRRSRKRRVRRVVHIRVRCRSLRPPPSTRVSRPLLGRPLLVGSMMTLRTCGPLRECGRPERGRVAVVEGGGRRERHRTRM